MRTDFIQADTYADQFGRYRAILHRLLNHDPQMFDLPKSASIADVGCGYGDLLLTLKNQGHTNLLGVEPDPVCRFNAAARGLDIRDGTLTRTGLPGASCDVALVNAVFHHVDDYEAACTELARILKPRGTLCFVEPAATLARKAMDVLTFDIPLRRIVPPVQARYDVMILEMETGLYPKWLREQPEFLRALRRHFNPVWHRTGWLFQFGKYLKAA